MRYLIVILILSLSFPLFSEDKKKGKGGDDFRAAAVKYESKAKACLEKGYPECSKIYFRMAAIKKNAAQLADEGKWSDISWDEYFSLQKQLQAQAAKHSKKHKNHKK